LALVLFACEEPKPAALPTWQQGLVVVVPSEEAGEEAGFERELVGLFAQQLQLPVRLISASPDQGADILQAQRAHFAATGMSRGEESTFRFGPVYRTTQFQVVCGAELPPEVSHLVDLPLAVVAGSVEESALLAARQKQPTLQWASRTDATMPELLTQVAEGAAVCTVVDADQFKSLILLYPGLSPMFNLGAPVRQVWVAPADASPELLARMEEFFVGIRRDGTLRNLLDRHFGDRERGIESTDAADLLAAVETELPRYRKLFEEAGRISGLDWHLIAAIAFHESKWDPQATSPTNVRGMMMLTEDTAERMGVRDRLNPRQSIRAGAKYLQLLKSRLPDSIAEPDRTWFALAAYNQGAAHLEDARVLAQRRGLNPDLWVDVKSVFPLLAEPEYFETLKFGHARGGEAVFLVEQIRDYIQILRARTEDSKDEDVEPSILHSYFHPFEGMPRLLGIL
jgi:membrane-bound lytic murein transglycosylase F